MTDVICSCHRAIPRSLLLTSPRTYACSRAREFDIDPRVFLGSSRERHLGRVRAVIAGELRQMGLSFPEIGRALNRHHASIINLLSDDREP